MFRRMSNPQAGIDDLLNQNPNIKNLVQSGGDLRAAFYSQAAQKGVDPESILEPLRSMMSK